MTPPPPTKLRQATKTFVNNSGLLMLGTLIALVWANLERESYVRFAHSLHFIVNDIGMAFFFALAAKEVIEATAPGGALHSPRRAAMPLVGRRRRDARAGADLRDDDDRVRPAESRARLGDSHAPPTSRSATSPRASSSARSIRRFRFCCCWRLPMTRWGC